MAISLTLRNVTGGGGSDVETRTSGSFTPTADSRLFFATFAMRHPDSDPQDLTLTANTGGLTFTERIVSAEAASTQGGQIGLWTAPVGGSPSAMTVTVSMDGAAAHGWYLTAAFDAVGSVGAVDIKSGQLVAATSLHGTGGTTEPHTTGTLPSAATDGNTTVAIFGAHDADPGGTVAAPGAGGFGTTLFTHVTQWMKGAGFTSTTFTGTSASTADLGEWVTHAAASLLFELEEAGGGPPAPEFGIQYVGDRPVVHVQVGSA